MVTVMMGFLLGIVLSHFNRMGQFLCAILELVQKLRVPFFILMIQEVFI